MKNLLILLAFVPLFATSQIKFQTSWETGARNTGMQLAEDVAPDTGVLITSAYSRSGSKSLRFSLKNTDPQPQYGNKRRELTVVNNQSASKVDSSIKWYRWSARMNSGDWNTDTRQDAFSQWHDKSPSCSASPPLAIMTENGRYRFVVRYSLTNYCTGGKREEKYFWGDSILFNQWVDWVVYYNPRTDGNGRVQIWMNGKSVLNYYGPCNYVGSQPPYWKIGIYKWVWMQPLPSGAPNFRRIYFDMLAYGGTASTMESMSLAGPAAPSTNLKPIVTPDPPYILLNTDTIAFPKVIASDPEGGGLLYSWTKTSGPSATMTQINMATLRAAGLIRGSNYTFQCTVTDNVGNTTTASITVDVNKPPVPDLSGNTILTLPTGSSSYNAVSSSTDPDGTISSLSWTQIEGPTQATFSDSTIANPTISGLQDGKYIFRLTATDNDNSQGSSDLTLVITTSKVFIPSWKWLVPAQ